VCLSHSVCVSLSVCVNFCVFLSLSVCVCVSHCVCLYFSVCMPHSLCVCLSFSQFVCVCLSIDSAWTPVVQRIENWDGKTLVQSKTSVDELVLDIAPGQYFIGVQMKQGQKMSSHKIELVVDDYHLPTLTLSDIELAAEIMPGDSTSVKDGLQVVPLPSRELDKGQPVKIYYEVYGLVRDDFGRTHYRVDYVLQSMTGGTPIARVLRAVGKPLGLVQDEAFSVAYEQTGNSKETKQYLEIEVSASPPGSYRLVVTATDMATHQRATKEVTFQILPDSNIH